ncbi:hypothetical protein N9850_13170 [Granulosicoccus sp.]|nr:hypothetical protein [Granulosicoccus sp.]MDB4224717.1 hypothetical protein [Granulosicoccus sp.]
MQPLAAVHGTRWAVVVLLVTAHMAESSQPTYASHVGTALGKNALLVRCRIVSSHRSGTLNECEAIVCTVENAISIEAACRGLRTEIELPGVLRYVARLIRDIYRALVAIKGLFPLRFSGKPTLSDFSQQCRHKPC